MQQNTKEITSRDTKYDIAKGIGILLVIIGHTIANGYIKNAIYAMHMPLFFFISGFFFKNKYKTIKDMIISRGKKLIAPYIFTSCILMIWGFLKAVLNRDLYTWIKSVIGYIYGVGVPITVGNYEVNSAGAIWFFLALFWGLIAIYFLSSIGKKQAVIAVIVIVFISFYSVKVLFLPFSIQAGMFSLVYLYAGYNFKNVNRYENIHINYLTTIIAATLFLNIANFEGEYVIASVSLPKPVLNLINSFLGIYIVIRFSGIISKYSKHNGVIVKFGANSMYILCMHLIEMRILPWGRLELLFYSLGMGYFEYSVCALVIRVVIATTVVFLLNLEKEKVK